MARTDQSTESQSRSMPEQRPHVAFVLQGLGAGGSERIVSLVSSHLAEKGWTVTIFAFEDVSATPYYRHHQAVRIVQLGLKARKMGPFSSIGALFARASALRAGFKNASPDLIVSFLTRTNVMSVIAARGLRIPVVVSERNNPELQTVGPVWERLRRWTYPRAVGLITMTRGAMEYFPKRMRRREWVIPNPAVLPAAARAHRPEGRTICAVGRMVPQKGFDMLLDAFALLAAGHPEWNLVIWGDGPDRPALLDQRSKLGLDDRVSLPGITNTPGAWLADADMFVLSSRFEGWGLVLGEAMAAGLPVVSFDCKWGPAEMITHEESGLLVPDGNVAALAQELGRLCSDEPLRARLGVAAHMAMKRFSPDHVLAHWHQVLEDSLQQAPVS